MKIKIICGTYGHVVNGHLKAKNSRSEPFEIDDAEGARLISSGVAKRVESPVEEAPIAPPDPAALTYDESMTTAQLKEIAKSLGIEVKGNASKSAVLEALNSHFSGKDAEDDDDAEDAPSFEAAPPVE